MSRVFTNLTNHTLIRSLPSSRNVTTTIVRYYRKPKWMASTKSKVLKSHETHDHENAQELENEARTALCNSHKKTYRKSVWAWQKQFITAQTDSTKNFCFEDVQLRRIIRDGEEDINVRVKCRRDEELMTEWIQALKEIVQKRSQKEDDVDQKLEIAKKKVLSDMEKLKSATSLDDLDIAIESALSSEVEYNFALDKSGNVVSGRNNIGPSI